MTARKKPVKVKATRPLRVRKTPPDRVPPFVVTAAYASLPADSPPASFLPLAERLTTPEDSSCVALPPVVTSLHEPPVQAPADGNQPDPANQPASPASRRTQMTLTFKALNRRGNQAIYTGLRTAVRIPLAAFVDKTPPQTIEVEGAFAEAKQPRARMTPEERRAARKAAPKLTLAERIAKREASLAALKAKAEKEAVAV